jgi:glycogen debranching enzyme
LSPEPVAGLEDVLAPGGWVYASSTPRDAADPGRFHALFGRDALITALALLPVRPDLARATLRALAALQGTREDPETDEEPGKIVHEHRPVAELRYAQEGWPVRDGQLRYYGSADSTPWFLVVLASLGDSELASALEHAWRAAAGWLERALERGGGLLRHGPRHAGGGLLQQGWRDTTDALAAHGGGILDAAGRVPRAPLADADTQAVAVTALRAVGALSGDERWLARAERLRALVGERFAPDTMAIDGSDRRVEGAGSQLGWLLWADALPAELVARFAERLSEPDVLTDWGLRTLSSEHLCFAAAAYHRGAVWPFDSWLGWGGLRAAGRADEAALVRAGVLEAVHGLGLAPELYAVADAGPERVPIANRLQAWTVGARWALAHEWDGRASPAFAWDPGALRSK